MPWGSKLLSRPMSQSGKHAMVFNCFFCGGRFQFGPSLCDGKHIKRYKISVCSACWSSNWDGWSPRVEERLLAHLVTEELPVPERNEKGWLPRDGQAPNGTRG